MKRNCQKLLVGRPDATNEGEKCTNVATASSKNMHGRGRAKIIRQGKESITEAANQNLRNGSTFWKLWL
jgi:hypothetical protein